MTIYHRVGLALTLAYQFPAQLPTGLQAKIFGNVNSLIAFCLGAKDAGVPMAVNVSRAKEVIAVSWEKYKAEPFERTKPALRPSESVDLRKRKPEPPSRLREDEVERENL